MPAILVVAKATMKLKTSKTIAAFAAKEVCADNCVDLANCIQNI